MSRSFLGTRRQEVMKIILPHARALIFTGLRLGVAMGFIGVGELFELYSQHFLMEEFWALVVVIFLFAFAVPEAIAALERRVEYYASTR